MRDAIRRGAGDDLHARGDAGEVRAGRRGRRRLGAAAARRHAGAARHRSRRRGDRASRPRPRADRGRGDRGRRRGTASRVEPTLDSLQEAADFARDAGVDGFVSVGGGSSIDTAKVADLIVSHPAPVMDYVNPPVGAGRKPPAPDRAAPRDPDHVGHRRRGDDRRRARHPRPADQDRHLAPLPAPGAGDRRPRAGAHARGRGHVQLRPRRRLPRGRVVPLAAVRPRARRRTRRTTGRPTRARTRSRTSGRRRRSSTAAATCAARSPIPATSRRAGAMMLAATMAGVGFGSAGVHIPHACAYPIAGLKHEYRPPGYPDDHPFVPHGHLGHRHRAGRVPRSPTRRCRSATTTSPSCWPASGSSTRARTRCPASCST